MAELEEKTRQEQIHDKGFGIFPNSYGRIKLGPKVLEDAILDVTALKATNKILADKRTILKAIADRDYKSIRNISNYFYRINGIYQKACNTIANMYKYDWYVVTELYDTNIPEEKVVADFAKTLNYLDNSYVKKVCGEIALQVVRNGVYYGYLVEGSKGALIQELPVDYCRSRYFVGNLPVVEFNMKFFDDAFGDIAVRLKTLKLFPEEFQKGYVLYKQGKLTEDNGKTKSSWFPLEPGRVAKFSLPNDEMPLFINAIPTILDLDAAQELDRRKQMQKLSKIIVQKLPMDKNGDLIFDIDEAKDIHNNAVEMLDHTIGTDILTTFTDVDAIDLSDRNAATAADDLEKVERSVFNAMGISQNLFNTSGNLSLEKSILNDESSIRPLIQQFGIFFDYITQRRSSKPKKYNFRLYMLETTSYNYKDMSKMYKEQSQQGFSKILPQIALGHSQSAIINTAHFENEVLHLSEIMIPPLMSSTMSSEDILGNKGQSTQKNAEVKSETGGRPEKPDDQKSEKTIQNKEALS